MWEPRAAKRGLARRLSLTTRLFEASLEEAFPTALSSVDLCLEAVLKNELIVGKAWVGGRGERGGEELATRGVQETGDGVGVGQGRAALASGSSPGSSVFAHLGLSPRCTVLGVWQGHESHCPFAAPMPANSPVRAT